MLQKFTETNTKRRKDGDQIKLDQSIEALRQLMTVVPGPFQNITGMFRSSLHLPTHSLAESYTRTLHILKNSDKEFLRDNIAVDSFMLASLLHFIHAENIKSDRDLNFLVNSFREIFHCRKVESMISQKHPHVILSKAFADLVSMRRILNKADFLELKNTANKFMSQHSKSSIPEMKIVIVQFLSIKVISSDILCDQDSQALIYRTIHQRIKVIQTFRALFTPYTLERYIRATLNLTIRLLSRKTDNWIIRATYQKHISKIFQNYCNKQYLPEQQTKIFKDTLATLTSSTQVLNQKQILQKFRQDSFQKSQPRLSRTRRTFHHSSDTKVKIIEHKSSLHSLTTTNRAILLKHLISSKEKAPIKRNFSYSSLKKPQYNQNCIVIDNIMLEKEMYDIVSNVSNQNNNKRNIYENRTSIMDHKAGRKKRVEKRKSRSSKIVESLLNLEELTAIKFLSFRNGVLLRFEITWSLRGLVLKLYWIDKIHQILLQQVKDTEPTLSNLMSNVKHSIQSSPLYFQFFHNVKDQPNTQKIQLLNFIAKRKVTESQLKAAIYLKQFIPEYIIEGHAYARWLSGFHFLKRVATDANDATKLSNNLKDIKGAFTTQWRVPCSDLFRPQNKKQFLKTLNQMVSGSIVWQINKLSGEYVIRLVDFNRETFKTIFVNSKKLKLLGVELSLYTLQIQQLYLISKETVKPCTHTPAQILTEKIIDIHGIRRSILLRLLQDSACVTTDNFLNEGFEPPEGNMEFVDDDSDVYKQKQRRITGHNVQIQLLLIRNWISKFKIKRSYSCLRNVTKLGRCFLKAEIIGYDTNNFEVNILCTKNARKYTLTLKINGQLQRVLRQRGDTQFFRYVLNRILCVDYGFTKFIALPAKIDHLTEAVLMQRMNRDRIYVNTLQAICKSVLQDDKKTIFIAGLFRNIMFQFLLLQMYNTKTSRTALGFVNMEIYSQLWTFRLDSKLNGQNYLKKSLMFDQGTVTMSCYQVILFDLVKSKAFFNFEGSQYKQLYILKRNFQIILLVVDCVKQVISSCRWNEQDFEQKPKESRYQFQKRFSEEIIDLVQEDKLNLHPLSADKLPTALA